MQSREMEQTTVIRKNQDYSERDAGFQPPQSGLRYPEENPPNAGPSGNVHGDY